MSSNQPESKPKTPNREGASPGLETVLVVEDDPIVRRVAVRILEREGYTVLQAGSGKSAIALVEEQAAQIDLLLTDMLMPQMSGRELADRLKETGEIKVLFTSGFGTDDIDLDAGAAFIGKPYTPRELAAKVRAVLDG